MLADQRAEVGWMKLYRLLELLKEEHVQDEAPRYAGRMLLRLEIKQMSVEDKGNCQSKPTEDCRFALDNSRSTKTVVSG
jgi:hypothetical protein